MQGEKVSGKAATPPYDAADTMHLQRVKHTYLVIISVMQRLHLRLSHVRRFSRFKCSKLIEKFVWGKISGRNGENKQMVSLNIHLNDLTKSYMHKESNIRFCELLIKHITSCLNLFKFIYMFLHFDV